MEDHSPLPVALVKLARIPWNKGKLVGAKPWHSLPVGRTKFSVGILASAAVQWLRPGAS